MIPGIRSCGIHVVGLRTVLALVLALSSGITALQAQRPPVWEYRVKAAFLVNFARFVTWPEDQRAEFSVCVLGDNPFDRGLAQILERERLNGKTARLSMIETAQEALSCHLVFLAQSGADRIESARILADAPILTIADAEPLELSMTRAEPSSMITFQVIDSRVTFSIHLGRARSAGLGVSSKVLQLATKVWD